MASRLGSPRCVAAPNDAALGADLGAGERRERIARRRNWKLEVDAERSVFQSNDSESRSRMAAQQRSDIAVNIRSPRSVGGANIAPSTVISGPWKRPHR
jgi:hypothetical protein